MRDLKASRTDYELKRKNLLVLMRRHASAQRQRDCLIMSSEKLVVEVFILQAIIFVQLSVVIPIQSRQKF